MKAHGEADITWQDNILILEVHGPFNDEGVMKILASIKQSVLNKNIKSWYRIEVLDAEAMGSPQTISMVSDMYIWAQNNGCQATAVVISNLVQKQALKEIQQGTRVKVFKDVHQAKDWIAQQ